MTDIDITHIRDMVVCKLIFCREISDTLFGVKHPHLEPLDVEKLSLLQKTELLLEADILRRVMSLIEKERIEYLSKEKEFSEYESLIRQFLIKDGGK